MSGGAAADLLAARLASIRERVGRAAQTAGRDPASIRLLAVTKGHPAGAVAAAVALGLRDIGESRVQEATAKRAALDAPGVSWHMVGHLQRNKARAAAQLFDTVHSLDSATLAAELARHRDPGAPRLRVFIEVELTGLASRTGVEPAQAGALLDSVRGLAALEPVGLMTIAPPDAPGAAAGCFSRLRDLREALHHSHGLALGELSMGMSNDFEAAIAEGSTVIRLGRALFGDGPV
ncbi:MAG TPA: YggS family pyridoxal phosphate-dependent enzyme [Candidatus Dormibacteraeota bacterium]|nr:YggS family pyridoxal phosphate-dependent enzyme [Candidatus Dormibacteraeota bacterium]